MRAQLTTIERRAIPGAIRTLRGQSVILDAEIAALYGVETRALLQAVKRNAGRFPDDFMFRLNRREAEDLTSQSVISSSWGGRRHRPYAFTEAGVAMLSGVLRSRRAILVNIEVMRAFVRMRHALADQHELARRLAELEERYDASFREVFSALRALMTGARSRKAIGFGGGA